MYSRCFWHSTWVANAIGLYISSDNLYTRARLYSSNARNRKPLIDKGISLQGDRIAYLPTCIESETEEDLRVRRRRRNATRGETRCCRAPGITMRALLWFSRDARCCSAAGPDNRIYGVRWTSRARGPQRGRGRGRGRQQGDSLPLSTARDTFAR